MVLFALLKLFDVLMVLVLFFTGRIIFKSKDTVAPVLIKIWMVGLIVTVGLAVFVLVK